MDLEGISQDAAAAGSGALATSQIVLAILLLLLGIVLGRLAGAGLVAVLRDPLGGHRTLILRRIANYGIFALFAVSALHQLGIQLSVLLGAAGILSVAVMQA